MRDAADADAVPFEAEFLGQTNGLAATVLEELGDVGFGHGNVLYPKVYIVSIYPNKPFGAAEAGRPRAAVRPHMFIFKALNP